MFFEGKEIPIHEIEEIRRALKFGALKYSVVKNICEKGLSDVPVYKDVSYINSQQTKITRDAKEYDKLFEKIEKL